MAACVFAKLRIILTYADADKEFVEVDVTIIVSVEEAHDRVGLVAGDSDSDLAETRVEFIRVNLMVSVERVEVSEGSSKTSDRLSTSGRDLRFNILKDYRCDAYGLEKVTFDLILSSASALTQPRPQTGPQVVSCSDSSPTRKSRDLFAFRYAINTLQRI